MLNLQRVLKDDRLLRALTGLNRKAFEELKLTKPLRGGGIGSRESLLSQHLDWICRGNLGIPLGQVKAEVIRLRAEGFLFGGSLYSSPVKVKLRNAESHTK